MNAMQYQMMYMQPPQQPMMCSPLSTSSQSSGSDDELGLKNMCGFYAPWSDELERLFVAPPEVSLDVYTTCLCSGCARL